MNTRIKVLKRLAVLSMMLSVLFTSGGHPVVAAGAPTTDHP